MSGCGVNCHRSSSPLIQAVLLLLLVSSSISEEEPTASQPIAYNDESKLGDPHPNVVDSKQYLDPEKKVWINQLDPVEVGHTRNIEVEKGVFREVKTMAMKPPIFVIPNFLSDDECEFIKSAASEVGFYPSITFKKQTVKDGGVSEASSETFVEFDADGDGSMSPPETLIFLQAMYNLSLSEDQLRTVQDHLEIDLDGDGELEELEFARIPDLEDEIKRVEEGLKMDPVPIPLAKELKKGKSRRSEDVQLRYSEYDPEMKIQNRVAALTGIHPDILHSNEDLTVVHYTSNGHYHAHYDTQPKSFNGNSSVCVHTRYLYPNQSDGTPPPYRVCRFMTLVYYLNEPEEGGGQTAFPVADNDTWSYEGIEYELEANNRDINDLANHCMDSNLVIEAKKGTAIMWYNHYIEDGWIGDINMFSLHGGCDVTKGDKWIANQWIHLDHNFDMQKAFIADWIEHGRPEYRKSLYEPWEYRSTEQVQATNDDIPAQGQRESHEEL